MDWKRRCELIPGGCSTMSKQPCRHVAGVYPEEVDSEIGAYICAGGRRYIGYECGLGALVLGGAYPRVVRATVEQLEKGSVYSGPSPLEAELAEKLVGIVPGADMVRFTNTGSEACHAAVKIARAYTGRERVLCCGYHGWFSWYSAQSPHFLGCTEDEKRQIHPFPYNDLPELERLFNQDWPVAAVIMEPYVFDLPAFGFLEGVRDLCRRRGAVLIFDEVVTGFRTPGWTGSAWLGVTPDLTCIGKAMSNGTVPISAVCGRRDLMEMTAKGCFVSGTFAANPMACAAALETIRVMEDVGVIAHIWEYGARLKAHFDQILDSKGIAGVRMGGQPCRSYFEFPTEIHKSLFWQECLKNGVWLGQAQFVSWSHQQGEFDATVIAMRQALDTVARNWTDPGKALEGKPAEATFRMMAGREKPRPLPEVPKAYKPVWKCLAGSHCPTFEKPDHPRRGPQVLRCPRCGSRNIMEITSQEKVP